MISSVLYVRSSHFFLELFGLCLKTPDLLVSVLDAGLKHGRAVLIADVDLVALALGFPGRAADLLLQMQQLGDKVEGAHDDKREEEGDTGQVHVALSQELARQRVNAVLGEQASTAFLVCADFAVDAVDLVDAIEEQQQHKPDQTLDGDLHGRAVEGPQHDQGHGPAELGGNWHRQQREQPDLEHENPEHECVVQRHCPLCMSLSQTCFCSELQTSSVDGISSGSVAKFSAIHCKGTLTLGAPYIQNPD